MTTEHDKAIVSQFNYICIYAGLYVLLVLTWTYITAQTNFKSVLQYTKQDK